MKNKQNIPIFFEENKGQQVENVKFTAKEKNKLVFFNQDEMTVAVIKSKEERKIVNNDIANTEGNIKEIEGLEKANNTFDLVSVRIGFKGCNKDVELKGKDKLKFNLNYLKDRMRDSVATYEKIVYKNLYNNIDLIYYSIDGNLKYDYIVKPNGDVNNIKLEFNGYDKIEIDKNGDLNVYIKEEIIKFINPYIYQEINENKITIEGSFFIEGNNVSFNISNYDKEYDLIIDPGLIYGTYLGCNDYDCGQGVAVDENEYAYISGFTRTNIDFPVLNGYQHDIQGSSDVFIIKIDTKTSGTDSLLYGSYLGGSNTDEAYSVAVDENENAYIVGYTYSDDFPVLNGYQETNPSKQSNYESGFIVKIDTKESGKDSLVYSSYLGGNGNDRGYGVAVDKNENVYITGSTNSSIDFPVLNGYQENTQGSLDVFIIKIDTKISGKDSLIYGSYLGGEGSNTGNKIAVDENENAYITGYTYSHNFPILSGYQKNKKGYIDAFIIKINTNKKEKDSLAYSSYLGGNNFDILLAESYATGVAVDKNENVYITGYTNSNIDFSILNGYQLNNPTPQKETDIYSAFLIKIDTKKNGEESLSYGSYLGGSNNDRGYAVSVDKNENAYITGYTYSNDFPILNGYQTTIQGYQSAFIIKIDTKKNGEESLLYSSYLGGNSSDYAYGVDIDKNNNIYIIGNTSSTVYFPIKNAYKDSNNEDYDAFLIKLSTPIVLDLSIEKSVNKASISVLQTLKYTTKISNTDYKELDDPIIFKELLPSSTSLVPNSIKVQGVSSFTDLSTPTEVNLNLGTTISYKNIVVEFEVIVNDDSSDIIENVSYVEIEGMSQSSNTVKVKVLDNICVEDVISEKVPKKSFTEYIRNIKKIESKAEILSQEIVTIESEIEKKLLVNYSVKSCIWYKHIYYNSAYTMNTESIRSVLIPIQGNTSLDKEFDINITIENEEAYVKNYYNVYKKIVVGICINK